jgi:hypothetical protein
MTIIIESTRGGGKVKAESARFETARHGERRISDEATA